MHARRRRRAAAMSGVVEYPERRAASRSARGHYRGRRRSGGSGIARISASRPRDSSPQQPAQKPVARHRSAAADTTGGKAAAAVSDTAARSQAAAGIAMPGDPAAKPPPVRPPRPTALALGFGHYLQFSVADGVHSGAGRIRAPDDRTDFYSVPLTRGQSAPGHGLCRPLRPPAGAGAARAADRGQCRRLPRRRRAAGRHGRRASVSGAAISCSRRNRRSATPGFKRFRPIVRDKDGALRRLTNAEIAKNPQYGDFSLEQTKLTIEAFYDRMDDVMSPTQLDPLRAMTEAITSLEEQVKARVTSVENGRKYQNSGKGDAEHAERRRDLRNHRSVGRFRDAVARSASADRDGRGARIPGPRRAPAASAMPCRQGKAVADSEGRTADRVLAQELAARKFSYPRSDGSAWTLTLKDAIDRVDRSRDGLQRQRLRRIAVGRAGGERRGVDLQAERAAGASARR